TRFSRDWSSDVCSSDLGEPFGRAGQVLRAAHQQEGIARLAGHISVSIDHAGHPPPVVMVIKVDYCLATIRKILRVRPDEPEAFTLFLGDRTRGKCCRRKQPSSPDAANGQRSDQTAGKRTRQSPVQARWARP